MLQPKKPWEQGLVAVDTDTGKKPWEMNLTVDDVKKKESSDASFITDGENSVSDGAKTSLVIPTGKVRIKDERSQGLTTVDNTAPIKDRRVTTDPIKLQKENEDFKASVVKPLLANYRNATQTTPDEIAQVKKDLDDKLNQRGFVNSVKAIAKDAYTNVLGTMGFDSGFRKDPLHDEKKQAKEQLLQAGVEKPEPTQIDKLAQDIYIDKSVKFNKQQKTKMFLNDLPEQQKTYLEVDADNRFKSLSSEMKDATNRISLNSHAFNELADELQKPDISEKDVNMIHQSMSDMAKQIDEDTKFTQENDSKLGTAQDELDAFKRNYGTMANLSKRAINSIANAGVDVASGASFLNSLMSPMGKLNDISVQGQVQKSKEALEASKETLRPNNEELTLQNFFQTATDMLADNTGLFLEMATPAGEVGGLAAMGVGSAGRKYSDMYAENNKKPGSFSPAQMAIAPIVSGTSEALLFASPIGKALGSTKRVFRSALLDTSGKAMVDNAIKQTTENTLKNIGVEMIDANTKMQLNNIVQNAVDIDILGNRKKGYFDNSLTVLKDGTLLIGMLKTGSLAHVAMKAVTDFSHSADRIKLEQNGKMITELSKQLNNPDVDPTVKSVVESQINKATKESSKIAKTTINKLEEMPIENIKTVLNTEKKLSDLSLKADAVKSDESMPVEVKQVVLDGLKQEYKSAKERKETILNEPNPETEIDTKSETQPKTTLKKESSEVNEKIPDAIASKGIYVYDGEKGEIKQDGQQIIFETKDKIVELGNVDELSEKSINDFGIDKEWQLEISLNDDNSVNIRGKKYSNKYSNPESAFSVDKEGNYSVTLETSKGQKRTFRGQQADEIVYQTKLKKFQEDATEQQIDDAIKRAEQSIETQRTLAESSVKRENKSVVKAEARKVIEPELSEVIEIEKTKRTTTEKIAIADAKIDDFTDWLKQALPGVKVDMEGYKKNGFSQDQIIDIIAQIAKQIAATGIEINEAISKAVGTIKQKYDLGDVDLDRVKERLEVKQPEKAKKEKKTKKAKSENYEGRTTGIKNAVTKAERAVRGKSEVEVLARRDFGKVFDEGKRLVDSGDKDPRIFAKELAENPRPLTGEESAVLVYDRMRLHNEYKIVIDKLADAVGNSDKESQLENLIRRNTIESYIEMNDLAARRTGYEQGLGLAARRMMVKEDYSLANLIQRAKIASGGEVSDKMRNELEDLHTQLNDANKRLEDYDGKKEVKKEKVEFEKIKNDVQQRQGKRTANKEKLKAERDDLLSELKKIAKIHRGRLNSNPIPLEAVPVITKLARNLIEDGIITLDGVVDNIHESLKDVFEDITKREIRDAISGYGKSKQPNKDELATQLREIKRQGKLVSGLEDAMGLNGEAPKRPARSGYQREEPSQKVRDLQKQIQKALRENGLEIEKNVQDPETAWKSALEKYKKRLVNKESDIKEKLEKEDYDKRPRKKLVLDDEATKLKANVKRLQNKLDAKIREKEAEMQPKLFKALDWFAKYQRGLLITSIFTNVKLFGAAMWRPLQHLPEEVISFGLQKIPAFKRLGEGAPNERISSNQEFANSLASYYSTYIKKQTYTDAWESFKKGQSDEEALLGKEREETPNGIILKGLEMVARTHGAMKYPAFKSKYESAIQKNAAYEIAQGNNPMDPMVDLVIRQRAFVEGLRDKFSQDNTVVKFQRMIEAGMDNYAKSESKNISSRTTWKVGVTMLRATLPITKIASNYGAEVSSLMFGGVKAAPLVGNWIAKGIESLKPEDKDYIIRNIKKQGVGVGLYLIGYLGYSGIASFYKAEKKKHKGELKEGEVFGLPKVVTHNPMFEIMKAGATYRHVRDEIIKGAHRSIAQGVWEGDVGILKENPYINSLMHTGRGLENLDSFQKASAKAIQTAIIPPDLKRLAETMDPITEKEMTRLPKDFVEQIESGVPILREKIKKTKKK